MKRVISAGLTALSLSAVPAGAVPFDGRWYMVCPSDVPDAEVMPVTIEGRRIVGYESECSIDAIAQVGNRDEVWRATLGCAGEGETWTDDRIFGLSRGDDQVPAMLVEIDMGIGSVVVYKACD